MTIDRNEIENAIKILDLPKRFSIKDLKEAKIRKLKEYHPDLNNSNKLFEEKTVEIINSYNILLEFCEKFVFDFSDDNLYNKISDNENFWKNRFGNDPIWGK